MDDITAPTISLKRAAAAAGLDLRWLRDTLADCRVTMLGQATRRAGSWNRASPVDVYRLLVLRRSLDCGFTLAEAAYILDVGVDVFLCGLAGCGVPLPDAMLLQRVAGHRLHVIRDSETDDLDVCFGPDTALPPSEDVVITFDLGRLAADALARLDVTNTLAGRMTALPGGRAKGGSRHLFNTPTADAANTRNAV